ncbi:hypothetical protein N7535_007670 [Penicillium sp. DV-2018c]|nr:hypothetical protein N7535_007670 [Penicillium sp. DV-2018c]
MHPTLTPYRRRVYRALLSVPPGRWTTYSALATYLGSSARAVGNAMRSNPFAPEVPCHRVLAADGRVGGYKGEWRRGGGSGTGSMRVSVSVWDGDGGRGGDGDLGVAAGEKEKEKLARLEEEGVVFVDGRVLGVCFREFVDLGGVK